MALGEGQEITLTFNTRIPSLAQLVVDASTKFRWKNDPAKVKKIYSAEKVVRPKQCSAKKVVRAWPDRPYRRRRPCVYSKYFNDLLGPR